MKFADKLVGKGLDTWLIIQLIAYNLSWMVVLVVPMSTLVAALMAYGNLSQNNEITIMKSSAVSLYRMMIAPLTASIVLAFLLFLFNDKILPDANHQAKILMSDISMKKPTLSLEPGFFSQEVYNYAILTRSINEKTNEMSQVTIYDYTVPSKINVVTASKGKVYFSADQKNLIMDLENGEIHESDVRSSGMYRKLVFEKHRITMDGDQFSFRQSQGGLRGERELNVDTMTYIVDSIKILNQSLKDQFHSEVNKQMFTDSSLTKINPGLISQRRKSLAYARILDRIRTSKNMIVNSYKRYESKERDIAKYEVEIHKKYSIPAACIIFILIGAPLGVMVKKGGFGVAASISLFFFLLYWAFLIGGEKLAERGFFSPFTGMWAANILLGIAGIILTIKTNRETVTINFTFLKKLIPKRFRYPEATDENSR
jgi:lipopolysaccharide export system permease protein